MKRRTLIVLLLSEAALCTAGVFVGLGDGDILSLMAFPFVRVGGLLRALSLSGTFGNVLSIVLYALLCLLPVAYLLYAKKKRALYMEDWLMPLLSALLFWVMYLMVNPGDIASMFVGSAGKRLGGMILGACVYSVLLGYAVLRLMRSCSSGGDKLLTGMKAFLSVLCFVSVFAVFCVNVSELNSSLQALSATGGGSPLVSGGFVVIGFLVSCLPPAFDIAIALCGRELTEALLKDRFGESAAEKASRVAVLCRRSVIAVTLAQIGLNVLQLLFNGGVSVSDYSVSLPLSSILFALLMLFISKYIAESGQLKRDNDMFV